jgi:TP901 family phage tail tape measure protein
MSEELQLKATFTAEDQASAVVRKLRREVDGLSASLRKAFTFAPATDILKSTQRLADQHGEIAGQLRRQTAELRTARAAQRALNVEVGKAGRLQAVGGRAEVRRQSETLAFNRSQMDFMTRMGRQRAQEDRQRESEHRATLRRIDRERASAGRGAASRGRDAYDRTTGGVGRATRSAGLVGALGFGATALAARKALSAEVDVDAAEINTRIYGQLSKDVARQLRQQWAGPLSETMGVATGDLLRSYVEAIKVGIPDIGAKAFSELSTKVSEAWDVPFKEVVDVLGVTNTILTSGGKAFDIKRIHSVANSIQHLSASMATTPEKMISFLRRGAGASQLLGMSQEAGLAFGAASTSLGNEAFSSGRAFDYMAGRLAELPKIVRRNGDDAKDARKIIGQLGYGSIGNLQAQQKANPETFVFDFLDRFNRIQDPLKRNESLRFFAGQEWLGELGRMVTGMATVRQAQRLANEAKGLDAIGTVWELHQTKLLFAFKQVKVGFQNIMGEAGMVLSPLAGEVRDYFMKWTESVRNGGFKNRLMAGVEGMIEGFGFKSLPDMLRGIFGEPGANEAGAVETWRKVAKGFAAGITDAVNAIKSALSVFSGRNGDAESMSRWAARILGFSAAMRIAQPAFDFLGGLATGLIGLGNAIATLFLIRKVAALSAVVGGGAVAGGLLAGGMAISLTGVALVGGALAVAIMNWETIKKGKDAVTGFWDHVWNGPKDEKHRQAIEDAKKQQRSPFENLGRALQELFGVKGARAGGLPPGYKNPDAVKSLKQSAEKISAAFEQAGARVQLASLMGGGPGIAASIMGGGAGGGGDNAFVGGSGSIGNGVVNTRGLDSRGILGSFGGSTFASKAPGIMSQLQSDFGLTREQAAGIVGNLGHESGGFRHMQELNPRGGRGGFGWAQWTGPRRRAFESWAAAKGLDPKSDQANYGFLKHELMTSERGALVSVRRQSTVQGATLAFERSYERAGVKNDGSRLAYANRALGLSSGSGMAGLSAGLIPVKTSGGDTTMMDPKAGFGQAFGGGATHAGVLAAAQAITGNIAGGVNRFTGFNDVAHLGRNSKHNLGLAGDFTLKDPSRSAEAAEQLRTMFRGAGLKDEMFRVIDEYRNPSPFSSGGHLHYQFNSQEAADQYAASQKAKALASSQPSAGAIASGIPYTAPVARPGGMFDPNGGAGNSGFSAPITIHGGGQSAEEIALQVQRRMEQAMRWRTHDYESELT